MAKTSNASKRKMIWIFYIFIIVAFLLVGKIAFLQFVRGAELQGKAIEQQTRDKVITSKRGTIYDRNMKALAVSASVQTVVANPKVIAEEKAAEKDARKLAEILEEDYKDIYKILTKNSGYEYVEKKVESAKSQKIKKAISDGELVGIDLIEDAKRYYPYGNFAAHVIGFTGTDNQGLAGIELQYDKYLTGTSGRIISAVNSIGGDMPYNYEKYYNSSDGNNVVLTIDEVIQHITENNLETAMVENDVKNGACAIVMDIKTGEILAMTTKPDFDLNAPFTVTDSGTKAKLASANGEEEYNKIEAEARNKMWRNKALVDSYEPGSTFKILTSAIALEENLVSESDTFVCTGEKHIADTIIHCWHAQGHGTQNFSQAIQNSCNPAFMEIGLRIGNKNFIKYVKGFNLTTKTGIDLPGEATGIFFEEDKMGTVEVATTSFGQGFQITPIQLISAVSAVANDGKYMKPHMVKEIINQNGEVVKKFDGECLRQIVSKETSTTICKYLEDAVTIGSGKNAYIQGYRIAGKTGTSEKVPRSDNKKIASMVAFAPADDPKVAVLVMLDEPEGGQYFGGVIAAPVLGNIINDVLQYLKVEKTLSSDDEEVTSQNVPQTIGKEKTEAAKLVKENGFVYEIVGGGSKILNQIPKSGSKLQKGSKIILYTDDSVPTQSIVPNVLGMTISGANKLITDSGLNMKITGAGRGSAEAGATSAATQTPAPGTRVDKGSIVYVEFRHLDVE